MRCPVCKSVNLSECSMSTGLKGYKCQQCEGTWVKFSDYENWKSESEHNVEENLTEYMPEYDYKKAILCPDCGIILIKYKVAKNIPFYLDHCNVCNGVWLNKSEWDNLIKNNLHYHMNSFFTKPWQNKLRIEMTSERLEQKYIQSIGSEDYNKLVEIRKWIYNHAKNDELIHFLIDEDPYKI